MSSRSAPILFAISGLSQYLGAAMGVSLFALIPAGGVAWWRLFLGALFLVPLWRPWKQKWSVKNLAISCLFGVVLGLMNIFFYEAIARIPLGAAVSIEFIGPVVVALIGGRGIRSRIAAMLALAGVTSIGGWGIDLRDTAVITGALFALAAGLMWAGYIVLGQRIASRRSGVASLAVGCLFGALVLAPFMAPQAFGVQLSGTLLLMLAGVALLSTVLPYSVEAVALGRLSPVVFALLTALLPATSTIVGFFVLKQAPTLGELVGLLFVSVAVWLASTGRSDKPSAQV